MALAIKRSEPYPIQEAACHPIRMTERIQLMTEGCPNQKTDLAEGFVL